MNPASQSWGPSQQPPTHDPGQFDRLRENLQVGAAGDRQHLFEVREELGKLSRSVAQSPWASVGPVCVGLEMILRQALRHGSMDLRECAELARELLDYVEATLALPAPGVAGPVARRLPSQLPGDLEAAQAAATPEPVDELPGPLKAPTPSKDPSAKEATGTQLSRIKLYGSSFADDRLQSVNESRLGELLIRMGRLDAGQLDRALVMQKVSKKRLGEVLVVMGVVQASDLTDALDVQREETIRLAEGL